MKGNSNSTETRNVENEHNDTSSPGEQSIFGDGRVEPEMATRQAQSQPTPEKTKAGKAKRETAKGKGGWLTHKFVTPALFGLVAVGTIAWVLWPAPSPTPVAQLPQTTPQYPAGMLPKDASPAPSTPTGSETPPQSQTELPGSKEEVVVITPVNAAGGRSQQPTSPAPLVANDARRIRALEEAIASVRAELAETKARCPAATAAAPSRAPGKAKRRPAYDTHLASSTAKSKSTSDALAGWELNTVYRNQAWIRIGDRTYVVEPGDVIAGTRIIAIDSDGREVTTSAGLLR